MSAQDNTARITGQLEVDSDVIRHSESGDVTGDGLLRRAAALHDAISVTNQNGNRSDILNRLASFLNDAIFSQAVFGDRERALPEFFSRMQTERGIRVLLRQLLAVDKSAVLSGSFDYERFALSARYFLAWFIRRSYSLMAYRSEVSEAVGRASVFGVSILHDSSWGGVSGLEVAAGIAIRGGSGEALWLRIRLEQNGKLLYAEKRWEEWKEGILGLHAIQPKRTAAVANLYPIVPDRQSVLVDRILTFVPYAAIETVDESSPVVVLLEVIDRKGNLLAVNRSATWLRVSSDARAEMPIFSPMSRGIWSEDVVSLNRISDLQCRRSDGKSLKIGFNLDLFSNFDELPRALQVECRILDHFGRSVQTSSDSAKGEDGGMLSTLNLKIESPVSLLRGLSLNVPFSSLSLETGSHRLFCEVVVVAADGELLCGAISPVTISKDEPNEAQEDIPALEEPGLISKLKHLLA